MSKLPGLGMFRYWWCVEASASLAGLRMLSVEHAALMLYSLANVHGVHHAEYVSVRVYVCCQTNIDTC